MFRPTTHRSISFADIDRTDQNCRRSDPRVGGPRWRRRLSLTAAAGVAATMITVGDGLVSGYTEGVAALARVSVPAAKSAVAAACLRTRITLIAHRGTGPGTRSIAGHRYSEDTIPAFTKALESGANGFETDYWPTLDGRIVSHHDPTLERMTNGTGAVHRRLWSYVRRLHNLSGAAVPTADAVQRETERYGGQRQQEFKRVSAFSTGQLRALLDQDHRYVPHTSRRVLITADRLSALRRIRSLDPSVALGLIARNTGRPDLADLPRWLDVVLIELRSADAHYIRRAHAHGFEVSVRSVNDVRQLRRAMRVGADRAVTDRPERLGRAC